MRACLDKCYKMGKNLARNPTPEAKEEYKQAEKDTDKYTKKTQRLQNNETNCGRDKKQNVKFVM